MIRFLPLRGNHEEKKTIIILKPFMTLFWHDLEPQMNAILDMLIQELKSRGLELPAQ